MALGKTLVPGRHILEAFGEFLGPILVCKSSVLKIQQLIPLYVLEFGAVLATCSFDRTASIWEETVAEKNLNSMPQKKWLRRTNLVDSRTSVTDVKFAPKTLGLQLATSSADGIIRIYEAPDIMNLAQWTLQHEISCKIPLSCISWNPSLFRLHAPMICVSLINH
jgi:nucleoporin SEH1